MLKATITTIIIAITCIFIFGCGHNSVTPKDINNLQMQIRTLKQEINTTNKSNEIGRWQISFRDGIRSDTYLVDSKTGRVWREYRDPETEEMWWKESSVEGR